MAIIKGKGTILTLMAGGREITFASDTLASASVDTWVQSFGYGPKWKSETQSAFGSNDPVEVDDTYDGIKASFDIIETASKKCLAVLTGQNPSGTLYYFDPSVFKTSYIFANFRNTKYIATDAIATKFLGSVVLKGLKVVTADTSSAVDGVQTKKFDFDGTGVMEFTKPIQMKTGTGAGSDLTLTWDATAIMYDGASAGAILVLKDGEPIAKGNGSVANTYTESSASVVIKTATTSSLYQAISIYTPT